MNCYTVSITPTSPFCTPLDSDTLFGHICWALYFMNESNGALTSFLAAFDNQPPLVMSGGFPAGYLPVPLLRPMNIEEKNALQGIYNQKNPSSNSLQFVNWMKRISRQRFMAVNTLNRFGDGLSKFELFKAILEGDIQEHYFSEPNSAAQPDIEETRTDIWHNTINRISSHVIEGQLFANQATFYPEGLVLNVYIKTSWFSEQELLDVFRFISMNGYGADKSTGYGRFDVSVKNDCIFAEPTDFNAYILLSHTNSDILKNHDAFYHLQTKFGKLGGMFASDPNVSPFKKPVLQLSPGSVIFSEQEFEYFGENFKKVHSNADIQHYGVGYPVKMRVKP